MLSLFPEHIPEVDKRALARMGLDEETLIRRAGEAVAEEVAKRRAPTSVLIFCGCGNNGADGYATALSLSARGFRVLCVDVLGKGQRSEGGAGVLAAYTALLGAPLSLKEGLAAEAEICVDAVLGSGARKEEPTGDLFAVWRYFTEKSAFKVAVDLPLGVDAAYGTLARKHLTVDLTIMLSFAKTGLLSYPAREACGELVRRGLGIDDPSLVEGLPTHLVADDEYVKNALPKRGKNSHKGSFGRVAIVAGSKKYRGAALLSAEAAARCGAGLVSLYTEESVLAFVGRKRPEFLFTALPPSSAWTEREVLSLVDDVNSASALLVGPGCDRTQGALALILSLLQREGAPLVLDADALNLLASLEDKGRTALKGAQRAVCLTPHPAELARLLGVTVSAVQEDRMAVAMAYARDTGVYLLLKGAATVLTDGKEVSLNTTGSSALAKGGSGDVLAGAVAAFLAGGAPPLDALRLAAYLHGRAGDTLAESRSEYGVLPSELPLAMAGEIAKIGFF